MVTRWEAATPHRSTTRSYFFFFFVAFFFAIESSHLLPSWDSLRPREGSYFFFFFFVAFFFAMV